MMDDVRVITAKLLQSEAENQKLKGQLCRLISLVKKAWTGDHSAAIEVALIVGVAPPTLEVSCATDEIVAVPKPLYVNNWLRLTVGLINKQYKDKQTTVKAQQMLYLRNREAFFDEQMGNVKHKEEIQPEETEQRASLLNDLVETENVKRNELKLKLGVLSPDAPGSKPKSRVGSAKQTRNIDHRSKQKKFTDTAVMANECLVIRSRSTKPAQKPKLPEEKQEPFNPEYKNKPHLLRPKSAGCVTSKKIEAKKKAVKRRPDSANTMSTLGKKERTRSGVKKQGKGRIENKLNKTENDIALTVQLLQQRLGIDERGMV